MTVKEVVDNVWLIIVARVAIFVATFVALPVAGWLLMRAATTVDTVLALTQTIQIKTTQIDEGAKLFAEEIRELKEKEADHEARLRTLEAHRPY